MAGEKCKQLQILMHINEVSEKAWHLACESAARTCGVLSEKEPGEAKRKLALAPEALALLVGGVELKHGSLKPWYER